MTSAASVSCSSNDLLRPVIRRHRNALLSDRTEREMDEIWPQDEMIQSYDVGASRKGDDMPTVSLEKKLERVRSRRSFVASHMTKAVDTFHLQGRRSAAYIKREQGLAREHTRRSVTEVAGGNILSGKGGESSGHSIRSMVLRNSCGKEANFGRGYLHEGGNFMQGHCRMAWFARLKCTRFLRLVRGTLHCFDSSVKKRLWVVRLNGARVRVHHLQNKIVLSKLHGGYVIEFFLFDAQSCRNWGAALLRASTPSMSEWGTECQHNKCHAGVES